MGAPRTQGKPRSFQDLQPAFMRELQNWAKHEQTVELKEILRQNCIQYDGHGPVPSQIRFVSVHELQGARNLAKDDPALVAKARGPLVRARSRANRVTWKNSARRRC